MDLEDELRKSFESLWYFIEDPRRWHPPICQHGATIGDCCECQKEYKEANDLQPDFIVEQK
jgi:hypothetical protein